MELSRSRRGLQKKFVASLLIVGFAPGIVALFATYLYSIQTIKTSIGGSFQPFPDPNARLVAVMIAEEIVMARPLWGRPMTGAASIETAHVSSRMGKPPGARAL